MGAAALLNPETLNPWIPKNTLEIQRRILATNILYPKNRIPLFELLGPLYLNTQL